MKATGMGRVNGGSRSPRWRLGIAWLLVPFIAWASPVAAIVPHLANIPVNTWVKLAPTPMPRYYASSFGDCTQSKLLSNPIARGYSGPALGDGKLFYFGGGHNSHPGNDVELYDIAQNVWTQMYPPECLPACAELDQPPPACTEAFCPDDRERDACRVRFGGFSRQMIEPSGRPYVTQTYQQHVWDPIRRRFINALATGLWSYDPVTNQWEWISGCGDEPGDGSDGICGTADDCRNRDPYDVSCGDPVMPGVPGCCLGARVLSYDPDLQTIVWFTAGQVHKFDYATKQWAEIGTPNPAIGGDERFTAYNPDGHYHLVILRQDKTGSGEPQMYKYDAVNGIWTPIHGIPDLRGDKGCWPSAAAYDLVNKVFLFLVQRSCSSSGPVELWEYNPIPEPDGTWRRLSPSGPVPVGRARWQPLWYDPDNQALFYLNMTGAGGPLGGKAEGDMETWVLRYAGGAVTPAGTPTLATQTPEPTPVDSCKTLHVGPTRSLKVPSQAAPLANDCDTIEIDAGTYIGDAVAWYRNNLTLRGVGGMVHLDAGGKVALDKAIWVMVGDNATVENIDFSCASSIRNNPNCSGPPTGDQDNAGLRLDGSGVTIRNCIFRDNDNGFLGGSRGDIVIENSEFFRNGYGDGLSHNLYVFQADQLTFRYNYSHGARIGHELKSRAKENYILYNRFVDGADGTASYDIDLPNGGLSYIIGNVVQKGPQADNNKLLSYAAENQKGPLQELYVANNTFVSDFPSVLFVNAYGSPVVKVVNNIFVGTGPVLNWANPPGGTATLASNITTEDPLFQDRGGYDYHLRTGSPAIDAATDAGDARGFSLAPSSEYVYDVGGRPRPQVGPLDIGAFEHTGSETPIPTPTPADTPVPANTPTRTPTLAVNQFCPNGTYESTYSILASDDDATAQRWGQTYPPTENQRQLSTGSYHSPRRSLGNVYRTDVMLLRWNTAKLPDDSPWPAGAQVTSAYLRPHWLTEAVSADGLDVVFEWYSWTPPVADRDWINSTPLPTSAAFAAAVPYTSPMTAGYQTIALANVEHVSLSEDTGIRVGLDSAAAPTGENYLLMHTFDRGYPAQLVLCWRIDSGIATPTPSTLARPSPPTLL